MISSTLNPIYIRKLYPTYSFHWVEEEKVHQLLTHGQGTLLFQMLLCLYALDVAVTKFLSVLASYSMAQEWKPNSMEIT